MFQPTQAERQKKWWDDLTLNWEDLLKIIEDWHPSSREQTLHEQLKQPALEITAPGPESACSAVRSSIAQEEKGLPSPTIRATKAKEERDAETMLSLLNGAWFGVPESLGAWGIPGFGVLCDLCADADAFYEEEDQQEAEV